MRANTPELDLVQNGWKRETNEGALMWRHPDLIGARFTFEAALDADEQLTRHPDDAIAQLELDLDRALAGDVVTAEPGTIEERE